VFLFIFSVIVMKSFFVSLLDALGAFFPIPCALAVMSGVVQIKSVDAIDVIALFLICGIGADCLLIIFELFRQARVISPTTDKKRLASAAQRGIIALATSISTSGVSFLALLTSGVRVMNFFGVFAFLLLFFTFIMTFTWYLAMLSIWARHLEPQRAVERGEFEALSSRRLVSASQETSTTTSSRRSRTRTRACSRFCSTGRCSASTWRTSTSRSTTATSRSSTATSRRSSSSS
jgi:predicted RND superfamily exporter protein